MDIVKQNLQRLGGFFIIEGGALNGFHLQA